jgi:hypothetical protein
MKHIILILGSSIVNEMVHGPCAHLGLHDKNFRQLYFQAFLAQLTSQLSLSNSYSAASVHLSVCLSIKQARFVTMGAIDQLLCEEIPLGQGL